MAVLWILTLAVTLHQGETSHTTAAAAGNFPSLSPNTLHSVELCAWRAASLPRFQRPRTSLTVSGAGACARTCRVPYETDGKGKWRCGAVRCWCRCGVRAEPRTHTHAFEGFVFIYQCAREVARRIRTRRRFDVTFETHGQIEMRRVRANKAQYGSAGKRVTEARTGAQIRVLVSLEGVREECARARVNTRTHCALAASRG